MTDLGLSRSHAAQLGTKLMQAGVVQRVGGAQYIVLRRMEDVAREPTPARKPKSAPAPVAKAKPRRNVVARPIHRPIPVPSYDTRDLTGRVFGDPLPGRSALDMKRAAAQ